MDDATPPISDDWSVQRILEWTARRLRQHGSESPRLDAEILLAHARGCRRIDLYTRYDEILSAQERAAMRDLVQRRMKHEPVAYLVGHREFYNLDFRVTPDVLIPRPDTESLVMELLAALEPVANPRVLEIGTGSACIAVSVAKNRPDARVTAVDVSEAALAVARENAARHETADRIEFLHGDLFAPVPPGTVYDAVVSNPPYVRDDEMEALQPDARLHEPHTALNGGPEGLAVIRRLVAEAPSFLRPGGTLMIEIGHQQADAVRSLLESHGTTSRDREGADSTSTPAVPDRSLVVAARYADVRIIRDLGQRNRVAAARRT